MTSWITLLSTNETRQGIHKIVGRNTLVSAEDAAEAVMILLSMLVDAGSPKLWMKWITSSPFMSESIP